MINKEFAFNYAGKEFMHYGNRVALVGHDSENPYAVIAPPVEIRTGEGVRGIQFSTDGHGNVQAACIRGKHGGMKLVSMGDGLENVSSKI